MDEMKQEKEILSVKPQKHYFWALAYTSRVTEDEKLDNFNFKFLKTNLRLIVGC